MTVSPCTDCGTTEEALHYASGKMRRCKDCQRFYNVKVNSKRTRAHQHSPQLGFSHDEFVDWCRTIVRSCAYCGIEEASLEVLGIVSTIGLTVAALGIDRIDNNGDYAPGNIQFCCFACNKAKGNVFSHDEAAQFIGPGVADAWRHRLGGPCQAANAPEVRTPTPEPQPECRRCGRTDWSLENNGICRGCVKYASVAANAKRKRKLAATPNLEMTKDEFLRWLAGKDLRCRYCNLPESRIIDLGVKTQVGHPLRNLGIDRLDNDHGYRTDNIALCCYPCNKVKGNVFTDAEMLDHVGPAIGQAWAARVAALA